MKIKILVAMLLASAVVSVSAEGSIDDKKKEKIISSVDQRISILETFKSCVQASSTKEAIKACKSTKKEEMKKLKDSRKNKI